MNWKKFYQEELGEEGLMDALFDSCSEDEKLKAITNNKGFVSIPHTSVHYSGRMTARLVHQLYSSGIEKVIALGVIHGIPDKIIASSGCTEYEWYKEYRGLKARKLGNADFRKYRELKDRLGKYLKDAGVFENFKGGFVTSKGYVETAFGDLPIFRPSGLDGMHIRGDDGMIREAGIPEFSLDTFFSMLSFYAKREGVEPIKVLPVFVGFGGPGIAKDMGIGLRSLVDKKTALVCTGDFVHYGHGYSFDKYGIEPYEGAKTDKEILGKVKESLGLALSKHDYDSFASLSEKLLNDQSRILPIVSEYLGKGGYKIFEFRLSDYSEIINQRKPCLVASMLAGYFSQ